MKRIVILLLFLFPVLLFGQGYDLDISKQNWQFRRKGDQKWNPAAVPGTVHTDLLNNKLIPEPFYGDNESKLKWIENEDWEYQTTFTLLKGPAAVPHLELQFEGLDTYANVYLNDSLILKSDNMFRIWNVDVKKYIHEGENKLLIVFESALRRGRGEAKKLPYVLPGDEKVFTRKAQYQYGWDWGPRFVTCGIWKNIKLNAWKYAEITNVRCVQHSLTDSVSDLEFVCEVKSDLEGTYKLWLSQYPGKLVGKDERLESSEKVSLKKGVNHISVHHKVFKPERWWCNGYGKQTMYSFEVMLLDNGDPHTTKNIKIYDGKQLSVGLRTIELVQEKDSVGSSFYFKLNGTPVFVKGANYIPQDNFMPRVTSSEYEKIISNAVNANMNMLRVWGGGVYESDEFYKQCDKQGILVWQDFMFACAMYPGDQHFMENVAAEVSDQTMRLRNHPCIALWCGNNEIDEGWKNWGWQKQYKYSEKDSAKIAQDYLILFENLIKDVVKANDDREYWPSSPGIGWGHKESLLSGDSHYWGVWWGMEPLNIYEKKVGRFVTEYGFQGMPNLATFLRIGALKLEINPNKDRKAAAKRVIPTIDSVVFKAHQKHPTGYQTIRTYMERDYKVPEKFADYIYVSQLLQARAMRTAIEAHRNAKPYCMGTLYWQLNDCWPVTSWSTVDHTFNWKAAHYQVKRSYEPVLITVREDKDDYKVQLINDGQEEGGRKLWIRLIDFKGKLLWEQMKDVTLLPNGNVCVDTINKKEFKDFDLKHSALSLVLMIPKALEVTNASYCFVTPGKLMLERPNIKTEISVKGQYQCISLSSDVFAKDVAISIDGESLNLSDNYFDLLPGVKKTIFLPIGAIVEDLNKKVKIRSLIDTY